MSFLVSPQPVPEELKRLANTVHPVLNSGHWRQVFCLVQFDSEKMILPTSFCIILSQKIARGRIISQCDDNQGVVFGCELKDELEWGP